MLGKKHENIINEIVAIMQREKREINRESIRSFMMTQIVQNTALKSKLGGLTNRPIYEYCEKFGIK